MTRNRKHEQQFCLCPTCGHKHQIAPYRTEITTTHVRALRRILDWCIANGKHEFRRREAGHVFKSEVETTTFAHWPFFGGLVYRPVGPNGKPLNGHYGVNIARACAFFRGELAIPLTVWRDPVTQQATPSAEVGTIREIPNLSEFLDIELNYEVTYDGSVRKVEPAQSGLF